MALAFGATVPVLLLIWGVFLYVVIYYGKNNINKLTTRPLKWIIAVAASDAIFATYNASTFRQTVWLFECPKGDLPYFQNSLF